MVEDAARLRAAAEALARATAVPPAYWRPLVGYDECVGSKELRAMLRQHERDGTIQRLTPLWWEQRVTSSGTKVLSFGGAPAGRKGDLDYGYRLPGDSWSDVSVVGSSIRRAARRCDRFEGNGK